MNPLLLAVTHNAATGAVAGGIAVAVGIAWLVALREWFDTLAR